MSAVFKGVFSMVAKQYQGIVASRCAAIGVKYEDLLVENEDMEKALSRIPQEVKIQREQRIKRAFDCSVKRKTIPVENQPSQAEVLDLYLAKEMDQAQIDREERAVLNSY